MSRAHWAFKGWHRVRNIDGLLKHRDVPGAYVASATRLLRVGPWMLMAFRYRPGPAPTKNGSTTVDERLSPYDLWVQAEGDSAEYRRLLVEHGHVVAKEPGDDGSLPCGWKPKRPADTTDGEAD